MKVIVSHRTYGAHHKWAEAEIPGEFSDYCTPVDYDDCRTHNYRINEDLLISNLPKEWNIIPSKTLLSVQFDWGGSGQYNLTKFRDWAKYFSCNVLGLFSGDFSYE